MRTIDLDHAATTPLAPEAFAAMLPFLRPEGAHGNPASGHANGRAAAAAVDIARAQVAALIGAEPGEIVWTSGATESDNLALKGALEFYSGRGRHLVTARTEHKAVLDSARWLETRGVRVTYLDPGADGRVSPESVLAALQPDTVLVSLMWVNNETGVIQDIGRLAPALRERGVLLHVDAAQAAGRVPIDVARVPVDLLSLSAHKLYGPKGIGALYVRRKPRARLAPMLHGGGHEQGMRSGTLPTHQLAGFGAAAELAAARLDADQAHFEALRRRLEDRLLALPQVFLNGAGAPRVPGIVNFSFAGVDGEALRAGLPDLALSSGAACSAATREASYVLRALGRDDVLAGASLRFSPGRGTSLADVDAAADGVIARVQELRALNPAWTAPHWPEGGGQDVLTARAATHFGPDRLLLQVKMAGPDVLDAKYQAYGGPVTLAVGAFLAREAVGKPLTALQKLDAVAIRQALEIGEERTHCALLGEDVVKSLLSRSAGA